MITVHPYDTLGHADHGWLNARHHFSFASYYDPNKLGFGVIKVINDDIVKGGFGFDTHPHRNMEIITYVRTGAITHEDNKGNKGVTTAGNIQVMSAGSGIYHSEHNRETEDTSLYQIWIEPHTQNVEPRWDAKEFPKTDDGLSLLVSGDGTAPLSIHQNAKIYAGPLNTGTSITQAIDELGYILVSKGAIEVNGTPAKKGDGVAIEDETSITITATEDSEILVLDVPKTAT